MPRPHRWAQDHAILLILLLIAVLVGVLLSAVVQQVLTLRDIRDTVEHLDRIHPTASAHP